MTERPSVPETGVITKESPRSVPDTVSRLIDLVTGRGMRIFTVIDQAAAARDVGLELRETTAVLFGSPTAGTPVMAASPLSALDLPLKIVVWADGDVTNVSYVDPGELARRHGLSPELAAGLAGIGALTEALIAR